MKKNRRGERNWRGKKAFFARFLPLSTSKQRFTFFSPSDTVNFFFQFFLGTMELGNACTKEKKKKRINTSTPSYLPPLVGLGA